MAQGLDTTQNQKTPESLKKVQGDTGNPEVDELLEKGREMIAEIRRENDLIPDSSLSDKLDTLENKCAEIFRAVCARPLRDDLMAALAERDAARADALLAPILPADLSFSAEEIIHGMD